MLFVFMFFIFFKISEIIFFFFFFQAEDGIRDKLVTEVQTCALPIIRALDAAGISQPAPPAIKPASCPPYLPVMDWYARFVTGPQVNRLTPKEKGWLAIRNLADPFNFVTIAGNSAIYVAADSHSPYGPGFPGMANNMGISYTEDATSEFFGTFLIPSLVHQDPHY